jgi:hypothetical protein
MQRNAEVGLFTKPSFLNQIYYETEGYSRALCTGFLGLKLQKKTLFDSSRT